MEEDSASILTGVGSVVPSDVSGQGLFSAGSSDGFAARLDELVRDTGLAEGSRAVVQNANETEAVGTVDFEHAISASWNSLSAEAVEPVWNTGFWRCIFGGQSLGESLEQSFKRPVPVGEIDVASDTAEETGKKQRVLQQHDLTGPLFQRCVKSSDNSSLAREERGAATNSAQALDGFDLSLEPICRVCSVCPWVATPRIPN